MRSHRRRLPVDHILIAGQTDDLACIRAALAILPAEAYGQVFIQADTDTSLDLGSPARITVHRIDVDRSLADAIDAWVAEWVPDEHDPSRRVTVWVGAHASPHVASAYADLEGLVEHL